MESLDLAKKIAHLALDKKAENVVVLDMREIVNYCDYFVICSGTAARHAKAIANGIDEGLHEIGIKVKFKQGGGSDASSTVMTLDKHGDVISEERRGHWVLLDMGDVVTHIFEEDSRDFYGLEHLWQEAVPLEWKK